MGLTVTCHVCRKSCCPGRSDLESRRMNEAIARNIELSLLTPLLGDEEFRIACVDAERQGYAAVSVPGSRVIQACHYLEETEVKVSCLVGFPFGWSDADAKRYEVEVAVDNGAHEIEVVMNLARFRAKDYGFVLRELRDVVEAADERPVKVLVESELWSEDELVEACRLVVESGAEYLSTSTGFNGGVADAPDVAEIRRIVGERFGIKASGLAGFEAAEEMIQAGATRVGDVGVRALKVL